MDKVKVETVIVDGKKYINISDLIIWLHTEGNIDTNAIDELMRLREKGV